MPHSILTLSITVCDSRLIANLAWTFARNAVPKAYAQQVLPLPWSIVSCSPGAPRNDWLRPRTRSVELISGAQARNATRQARCGVQGCTVNCSMLALRRARARRTCVCPIDTSSASLVRSRDGEEAMRLPCGRGARFRNARTSAAQAAQRGSKRAPQRPRTAVLRIPMEYGHMAIYD